MAVPGPGAYERAQPIFRPSARTFHPVASIASWSRDGDAVALVLKSRGGPRLHARVSFAAAEVVRLQWGARPLKPHVTEMLEGTVPELPLRVEESAGRITISAGGPPLTLQRDGWGAQ